MNAFQVMSIVSCVTSVVTLIVICIATLPHLKSAMVVVRDAVLWIVFVVVMSALLFIGFQRVAGQAQTSSADAPSRSSSVTNQHYAGK